MGVRFYKVGVEQGVKSDSYGTFTLPSSPMVVRRDATNWWQPFDIAITVSNNATPMATG